MFDTYNMPIKELSNDRYLGFCLARRHGARRAIKAIRRHNCCYRKIFIAALRDVGKQRLISIVSHRDHIWLAIELMRTCIERLTVEDKKDLIAKIVKYGDSFEIRRSITVIFLEPSLRRPILEKVSENYGGCSILLDHVSEDHIRPPLTGKEKIFLTTFHPTP